MVYLFSVFRIVIPLLDYTINFNYIVTEKCVEKDSLENLCLGQCYLSEKVLKQLETPEEENSIVQIEYINIPHLFSSEDWQSANKHYKIAYSDLQLLDSYTTTKPLVPPPKDYHYS